MADKFQLKAILSAVDKISPTFKQINKSAKILHKSLRDIGNAGSELMRKVGIPAFLSFSAVSFAAIRATQASIEYASSIQDAADRTGAGIENYQSLANQLGQVGGTAEDAEAAFSKFNLGIAKGAKNKEFFTLMKKLKVPLKDAKGSFSSLTDVLPQLAAGFAKNKDNPAIMTRMAKALFGKGGIKMIPVLLGIADGSLALADAQKKMGAIVETDSVGALDNLGDSLDRVKTQARATMANALAKLVPVIQPILDSMQDWIGKNQEFIKSTIVSTLTEVVNALKNFDWKGMFADIKSVVSQISEFVKAIGGVKVLIYGLGLAWAAGPIAAIFTIVGAIGRLSLAFTALAPVAGTSGLKAATSFAASLNTGMTASLGALATSGALLLAAAGIGYAIGTVISDHFLSDEFKENIGRNVARTLAFFGNQEAKDALINSGDMAPTVKTAPSYGQQGSGGLFTTNAEYAAMARNKSNLVANQNKLNGQMTVKFENAPAGMRVDTGKTNQSGVAINADVGYRTQAYPRY